MGVRVDGNTLKTSFILSDAPNRYGGLALNPADWKFRNYSGTRFLCLEYRTQTEDPLRVQILLDAPGRTRSGEELSRRYLFWELPPSSTWRKVEIPLSEFQTPDWWFKQNFVPPSRLPDPDYSRFLGVAICESEFTPPWKTLGVEVRSVRLEGAWWPCILLALLAPIPVLLLRLKGFHPSIPLALPFLETSTAESLAMDVLDEPALRVQPFGKPLPIIDREEQEFDRIVQFIAEHYPDPELALARVNKETGIPESRISAILEKRTGLHFKPYLNRVRIDEAMRLLVQTVQTVGEIAFQVGYSNTTHFNRVFKSLKQVSPGEFRKASGTKSENP